MVMKIKYDITMCDDNIELHGRKGEWIADTDDHREQLKKYLCALIDNL